MGADGWLYFPVMSEDAVWRVQPDTGDLDLVARDIPTLRPSFFPSPHALTVVASQSGEVLSLDLRYGTRHLISERRPGFDNLAYTTDKRLFVSYFYDGGVKRFTPTVLQPLWFPPGWSGRLTLLRSGAVPLLQTYRASFG